jgi:hypothetical protein
MRRPLYLAITFLTIATAIALSISCGGGSATGIAGGPAASGTLDPGGSAVVTPVVVEPDVEFKSIPPSDFGPSSTLGANLSGTFISVSVPEGTTYEVAKSIIESTGGTVSGYDSQARTFQVTVPTSTLSTDYVESLGTTSLSPSPILENSVSPIVPTSQQFKTTNDYGNWTDGGQNNWGLRFIDLDKAWDLVTGTASVKIGILDRDMRSHEDVSFDSVFSRRVEATSYAGSHGLHIAGTIGATTNNATGVAGINWATALVAYDCAMGDGGGLLPSFGFTPLLNDGCKIINASFGSRTSGLPSVYKSYYDKYVVPSMERKFKTIFQQYPNALIIQAAGNEAADAHYGGSAIAGKDAAPENIIVVAASDENGNAASFSNYGNKVDVAAPGVNIYSTVESGYAMKSGTSMATPHVVGLAGLLYSMNPDFTAKQVKGFIVQGAINSGKTCTAPNDPSQRAMPIINAYESVKLVQALNSSPVAKSQEITTPYESSLKITLVATDAENDDLYFALTTPVKNGILTATFPSLIYTPNPGFSGVDSFEFYASDYVSISNHATVSIIVEADQSNTTTPQDNGATANHYQTTDHEYANLNWEARSFTAYEKNGDLYKITYFFPQGWVAGPSSNDSPVNRRDSFFSFRAEFPSQPFYNRLSATSGQNGWTAESQVQERIRSDLDLETAIATEPDERVIVAETGSLSTGQLFSYFVATAGTISGYSYSMQFSTHVGVDMWSGRISTNVGGASLTEQEKNVVEHFVKSLRIEKI